MLYSTCALRYTVYQCQYTPVMVDQLPTTQNNFNVPITAFPHKIKQRKVFNKFTTHLLLFLLLIVDFQF